MDDRYTEELQVRVPSFWIRVVQKPVVFYLIGGLTGISITFTPLLMYWLGRTGVSFLDWKVLVCFCIGYLVPLVYFRLGTPVLYAAWAARLGSVASHKA